VAALAGAEPGTALRLGLSMLALQVSIGALNDLVDAPIDASQKPGKPLPRALVPPRAALVVAVAGLVTGLALSAPSGPATVAVAAAGAALGYAYDLRLSRTAWSWLPLSLALPLLPIHAWLGATGAIPAGLFTLVPAAVLAGAALALANGLVDLERDAHVARRAIAVELGPARAWAIHAGLLVVVAALAVFVAPGVPATPSAGDGGPPGGPGAPGLSLDAHRVLRVAGVVLGVAFVALGALLLRAGRPALRERGWELEAMGVAGIGIGWLAGTAATVGGGAGG
jgi:4-hydroxybenzoate polyprenyltransferase